MSTRQAARLQQEFAEGNFTDVVIRVRIGEQHPPPAAKRQRRGKAAAAADAADRYTDIKAHAFMLSANSAYFKKALSGEWTEASERRVELSVKDEQELEDLKLLIKLSYTDSYTHDGGGQLLPLATRLRVAVRADGLEFVEALDQVVASLPLGLDFAGVLACLNELPPQLAMHGGMAAAKRGMVGVLADGIAEREGEADEESIKELEAGADALAKCLGPVAGMFKEGTGTDEDIPLREDVKKLPPCVLKRLLASEALQVQLENEAYALLVAWLEQSPHTEYHDSDDEDDQDEDRRLALFTELAPLLRYHHMTTGFLATVVCECSLMQESGLLPSVMRSAIGQRDVPPSLLKESKTGKRDRGIGASNASWEVKASFTLEEVAALEPDEVIDKWCGLVAGYPAYLHVARETAAKGDTLGAHFGVHLPGAAVSDDTLEAGVGLDYNMTLSPGVEMGWTSDFFSHGTFTAWGWNNAFRNPWAEAVREGSPHFPGGQLEVKATVKLAMKK